MGSGRGTSREVRSSAQRIKIIGVVGDISQDALFLEGKREPPADPAATQPGGAYFVARMLSAATEGLVPPVTIQSYDAARANQLCPLRARWVIRHFEHFGPAGAAPTVFRCVETPRPEVKMEQVQKLPDAPARLTNVEHLDLIVIEDLNLFGENMRSHLCQKKAIQSEREKHKTFQSRAEEWESLLDTVKRSPRNDHCPRLFAMINRHLPDFDDGLWRKLRDDHANDTVVILYADILRLDGFNISKQVSWERTAQDYLAQMRTDPALKDLSAFRHVVVRFGVTGAIHSYSVGKKTARRRVHRLYFDPVARKYGIYRDATIDGDLIGNNSILVASIIKDLVNFVNTDPSSCIDEYAIAQTVGDGIKRALMRAQKHFDDGYGATQDDVVKVMAKGGHYPILYTADCANSIADERIPVGNLSWNILNQSAEYQLVEIAHNIVTRGVYKALNSTNVLATRKNEVWAPIVRFEGTSSAIDIVDRREIESYRSVHNMLRAALHRRDRKPLSIAVFGPPGSGKSSSIGILAESAGCVLHNAVQNVNLSEYRDACIIDKVRDEARKIQKDTIPIVFFDEFDCHFEGHSLGWLKYFLALMEDWSSDSGLKGGPPIFVFVGGTSYTYRQFARAGGGGREQELKFAQAKGPDFVSRLSGHIDIIGPNPTDEYDQGYVIRRALVLRRILEKRVPATYFAHQSYDKWFQEEIIRAMLKVSSYKHGSRSLRTIVDMCVLFGGAHGKYTAASLPTVPQLDMHVDGQEFLARVEEAKTELRREAESRAGGDGRS